MVKRIAIISAFILECFFSVKAQTNENKAFQNFKKARTAFEQKNYKSSVEYLTQTKSLLGSTNIRIQPMLIKSLVGIQDWRRAKTEIATYYTLDPDPELLEYEEIGKLSKQVNEKVKKEESDFQYAKSSQSISGYEAYLRNYPYGKYRPQIPGLISNQKDENAWSIAKNASSTSAYFEYLGKYPNGNHADLARKTIERWDRDAYEKAITDGSQTALKSYLNRYNRGNYRSEVRQKLKQKQDEDAYASARSSNSIYSYEQYVRNYPSGRYSSEARRIIEDKYYQEAYQTYRNSKWYSAESKFQTYLQKYPGGKYASEVRGIIEDEYYKQANQEFSNKSWSSAETKFQTYLSKYPNGKYVSEATRKNKKSSRVLRQRSASFVEYTFSTIDSFGISFGHLNKRSLGWYGTINGERNILKQIDVLYTIDDGGNATGPWDVRAFTGKNTAAHINASGGITFKLFYPMWITLGGGVGYHTYYQQIDEFYDNGDYFDTKWYRNTDRTEFIPFPEAGVQLKLFKTIMLQYSARYKSEELIHQFGAGFAW